MSSGLSQSRNSRRSVGFVTASTAAKSCRTLEVRFGLTSLEQLEKFKCCIVLCRKYDGCHYAHTNIVDVFFYLKKSLELIVLGGNLSECVNYVWCKKLSRFFLLTLGYVRSQEKCCFYDFYLWSCNIFFFF